MLFKELNIPGVFEIQLEPSIDERGYFMRAYDRDIFKKYGLPTEWPQESQALTKNKGTIRGLHFLYPPYNESKLIRMVRGEGFWVFLDLRKGSQTLGHWGTLIMSENKYNSIFIPKGFANAVCTLTDDCEVSYHMDINYNDDAKSEIKWDDPELAIPWPIKKPLVLSPRDKNAQSFKEFIAKSGGGLII